MSRRTEKERKYFADFQRIKKGNKLRRKTNNKNLGKMVKN